MKYSSGTLSNLASYNAIICSISSSLSSTSCNLVSATCENLKNIRTKECLRVEELRGVDNEIVNKRSSLFERDWIVSRVVNFALSSSAQFLLALSDVKLGRILVIHLINNYLTT